MSFTIKLGRVQTTSFWTSKGKNASVAADRLQELFNKGQSAEYQAARAKYEESGLQFRLTKGKVFQISDTGKKGEVPIQFQVKGGTITWYIDAPMDETKQSFRDEVYRSAAIAHLTVDNHCERYYRGTNSLHVKKMHTHENEAAKNHNHYRVIDGKDVSSQDVAQHLTAFVQAQKKLDLVTKTGREKFLDAKEAQQIITAFRIHELVVMHKGPKKTAIVDGSTCVLPDRPSQSIREEYKAHPDQKFTKEDDEEWAANKSSEEPCRSISVGELGLEDLLEQIKASMRGIGSEKANTRQMEGSAHAVISTVVPMDDRKFAKAGVKP